MNPVVLLLDLFFLAIGAWVLIHSVHAHGMRATVSLVRLITLIMALFTAAQTRWEDVFDAALGRAELLNDFVDTKNGVLMTMSFYIMSVLLLYSYDVYMRRFNSTTEAVPSPPSSKG